MHGPGRWRCSLSILLGGPVQDEIRLTATPVRRTGAGSASDRAAFAIWPELAFRRDVPIERLPGDAQLRAQLAHLGAGLAHGGLCQAKLGRGHFVRASAVAVPGVGGGEARAAFGEAAHEVDQMAQVAPEPVQLPGHQRVAGTHRLGARFQTCRSSRLPEAWSL